MVFSENATVVVVHGAWTDGSSWQAIIRPLEERGFASRGHSIDWFALSPL